VKYLVNGDDRLYEILSSPQISTVNFCSYTTCPFVVAIKHNILEANGFVAVIVIYSNVESSVKSAVSLTPRQSEPVANEYAKG
jgi:hypothetical protein